MRTSKASIYRSHKENGVTLTEVLVSMAVLTVLAALILPALARGRSNAKKIECQNNLRQLQLAWTLYSGDHEELLPPNPDDGNISPGMHWVSGHAGRTGPDEFNLAILDDERFNLLSRYLSKNYKVFRCPADLRRGRVFNPAAPETPIWQNVPAARSVSMNQAIGTDLRTSRTQPVNGPWLSGDYSNRWDSGPFRTYGKMSSFTSPGPAMTWLLIDESTYNLNDAAFAFSMVNSGWLDFPGRYHGNSSGITFADGHTENKKWLNDHTQDMISESRNYDWVWLRDRTSSRR
jgi:prepilin-type N-terminal cleavage/methylation domain-containing protein/prepilin-type processing-associated H-X9-DG protein